jgi:hypothetical protein
MVSAKVKVRRKGFSNGDIQELRRKEQEDIFNYFDDLMKELEFTTGAKHEYVILKMYDTSPPTKKKTSTSKKSTSTKKSTPTKSKSTKTSTKS